MSRAALLFLFCIGFQGCITETSGPSVSINAGTGRIYAPRFFVGRWVSAGRGVEFRLPPGPAVVLGSRHRDVPFAISRLRRNQNGSFSFELTPLGPGPLLERTFRPPNGNMLTELEGSRELQWRRSP